MFLYALHSMLSDTSESLKVKIMRDAGMSIALVQSVIIVLF